MCGEPRSPTPTTVPKRDLCELTGQLAMWQRWRNPAHQSWRCAGFKAAGRASIRRAQRIIFFSVLAHQLVPQFALCFVVFDLFPGWRVLQRPPSCWAFFSISGCFFAHSRIEPWDFYSKLVSCCTDTKFICVLHDAPFGARIQMVSVWVGRHLLL